MDCMQFEYTNRSIHGELLCQNAVPYFNAMFEQKKQIRREQQTGEQQTSKDETLHIFFNSSEN